VTQILLPRHGSILGAIGGGPAGTGTGVPPSIDFPFHCRRSIFIRVSSTVCEFINRQGRSVAHLRSLNVMYLLHTTGNMDDQTLCDILTKEEISLILFKYVRKVAESNYQGKGHPCTGTEAPYRPYGP
jgi:hypothetical protein